MAAAARLLRAEATVAAVDLRWVRRSTRFWLFLLVAVGATLTAFCCFSYAHGTAAVVLLSGGYTGPRYLFPYFSAHLAWFALIGMAFCGADSWRRDERAGIAAPFRRETVDVGGVEFALLMHPDHWRNVRLLQDAAGDAIKARVESLLDEIAGLGIPCPYDALHVVEAPSRLRGYGGGWRLDAALALPGVLLLKEHGFPNARLPWVAAIARERGAASVVAYLSNFIGIGSDYTDERLLPGFVRNALSYQIDVDAAAGEGAPALAFLGEEIATRALTRNSWTRTHGFTAHAFVDHEPAFGTAITAAFRSQWQGNAFGLIGAPRLDLDSTQVWRRAVRTPLLAPGGREDADVATYALMLRGAATARAVVDTLGTAGVAAHFAELRRRHLHGNYGAAEFLTATDESPARLAFARAWLGDRGAPGFLVSDARALLAEDESGATRYSVRVHVRNDEPVPGVVRFGSSAFAADGGAPIMVRLGGSVFAVAGGDRIQIPGHTSLEIAHVAQRRPEHLYLLPYFSRNRGPVQLRLATSDTAADADALHRARPSAWRPEPIDGIVVDDLDGGFATRPSAHRGGIVRRLRNMRQRADDLPAISPSRPAYVDAWARSHLPTAFGTYRRTVAWSLAGSGADAVSFATTLPGPRRPCRVYYHVPDRAMPISGGPFFGAFGRFDLRLEAGGEAWPIEFDAADAEIGWNLLGEFPLGPGRAELSVSNHTAGELVVADAVLWRPRDGGSAPVES